MKHIAITGDRAWEGHRYQEIYAALATLDPGSLVVLGDAKGVDALAAAACQSLNLSYVVEIAHWENGKAAGPQRNKRMLSHLTDLDADEVWYFHDDLDRSRGTKNCVQQALDRGLTVRDGQTIT